MELPLHLATVYDRTWPEDRLDWDVIALSSTLETVSIYERRFAEPMIVNPSPTPVMLISPHTGLSLAD